MSISFLERNWFYLKSFIANKLIFLEVQIGKHLDRCDKDEISNFAQSMVFRSWDMHGYYK